VGAELRVRISQKGICVNLRRKVYIFRQLIHPSLFRVGCAKHLNFSFQNQQIDYSYIAIKERFTEKETKDFQ
jgi:hypothetical protein